MDHEFLFNRPPSPTSLDTLQMPYINTAPSVHSTSTDSSSSDAASQSSAESPRDWAGGIPQSWSELKPDDSWQWMDWDKIGANGLLLSSALGPAPTSLFQPDLIDPNLLKFQDAFASHQPTTQPSFPSAASPVDILGLPDLLTTLSTLPVHPQHPLLSVNSPTHLQVPPITPPLPSSPATSSASSNEGDEIAARAREAAGVRVAISQHHQTGKSRSVISISQSLTLVFFFSVYF
jgi:hypothetical protein